MCDRQVVKCLLHSVHSLGSNLASLMDGVSCCVSFCFKQCCSSEVSHRKQLPGAYFLSCPEAKDMYVLYDLGQYDNMPIGNHSSLKLSNQISHFLGGKFCIIFKSIQSLADDQHLALLCIHLTNGEYEVSIWPWCSHGDCPCSYSICVMQ